MRATLERFFNIEDSTSRVLGGGVSLRYEAGLYTRLPFSSTSRAGLTTGARAKAWCLLIHADASLSLQLNLSGLNMSRVVTETTQLPAHPTCID